MTGFYNDYKAVFEAVKTAVQSKATIKTVVLGEQFTMGALPKAVVGAIASPMKQYLLGDQLEVKIRGSVILVILEHVPKNWFTDVISVMGDVIDAILADRTLGGKCADCLPTAFIPGEIKFTEASYYGGEIRFEATLYHPSS